uniref:Uncharacterized protein n=1 Tax=Eutreptiella gymnastica TaxID=73025 RepID=A0A7S4CZM6_9EUGL|mmetsp:Transcript_91821/g.153935  ORF Transcript_91821/g.153935 Transcript_91821/m.153935 type:complete len:109 (-) Transcript_91821:464-790(-)
MFIPGERPVRKEAGGSLLAAALCKVETPPMFIPCCQPSWVGLNFRRDIETPCAVVLSQQTAAYLEKCMVLLCIIDEGQYCPPYHDPHRCTSALSISTPCHQLSPQSLK